MRNEINYTPVLKWKQGEQKAIEELDLSVKQDLTPLIEIPPVDWDFENEVPKKTIDEHLSKVGESLERSWGLEDYPLFVDLNYIEATDRLQNGQHPLNFVLQEARTRNLKVIPVTNTSRDQAYQNEIKSANSLDRNGICFRLKDDEFSDLQANIDGLLTTLNVTPAEVDLILDYEYVNPNDQTRTFLFLTSIINTLPYIHQWRNLVLIGTSFPSDLSAVGSNSIETIERTERLIWKKLHTSSISRFPSFGDYGISNPAPFEADPRFINMSANIRYTAADKYIIFKGRMIKRFGGAQYYQLASQVVLHPEYSGSGFSAGDLYIQEVANQNDGPGNATSWRKSGTNHHLTYVVNELSSVPLP